MRDENWRLCYKALLLLEFLVKQGPLVRTGRAVRVEAPPPPPLQPALCLRLLQTCNVLCCLSHVLLGPRLRCV